MLSEVLEHFGFARDLDTSGYFETPYHPTVSQEPAWRHSCWTPHRLHWLGRIGQDASTPPAAGHAHRRETRHRIEIPCCR